jgi:4'-phosphopantetheinyl transferase EntD
VTPAIVERTVARRGVAGLFTPNERAALETLTFQRRRQDWLAGRLAAKRAVRTLFRDRGDRVPRYSSIEVANDAAGAPLLTLMDRPRAPERVGLSIAHSDGTAVAAVSDRCIVGVDIEAGRSLDTRLVRRVLTSAELARWSAGSVRPSPIALWTAKEAAFKAAHPRCEALRDVELVWDRNRHIRAHAGDDAGRCEIVVRHGCLGSFTIAVAVCQ